MTLDLSRRSVLATTGAALLYAGTGRASAAARGVRLSLPSPTGPHRVGTTSLHLVDRSRRDPWTSTPRELMISLWFPAAQGHQPAPWLPSVAEGVYREQVSRSIQTSLDDVAFPRTYARDAAPTRRGRHPVVLFSPGFNTMREMGTSLVVDLASRGYAVVTISHTHEAPIVEFPGGRLELSKQPAEPNDPDYALALRVRRDDVLFVMNALTRLNLGSFDLSRVGIFGHSLGGAAAAEAMSHDARILAGADLDGSVNAPVATSGLDRPFLLMASGEHGRDNDPSWEKLWSHLRGWRRELRLRDSGHLSYTDLAPLEQQLIKALPIPPQVVAKWTDGIGTIDADRAVAVQRAYLAAFFDLHLRGRNGRLLAGPSRRYPEIEFMP